MFQIAIIVFREILEISLILSILVAATSGVPHRSKLIFLGLALGVFGSGIVALFTDNISEIFDGTGQEIFNASILLISSAMISWTVVWMKSHSKTVAADLKRKGKSVTEGNEPLLALLPITAFTVLREGSEIVLFSYGSYVSGTNISHIVIGGIIGLVSGLAIGLALYYGLLKAFGKHFFSVTSWLLSFLAAGMVAQALRFLSNADLIPVIKNQLWDSSFLIAQNSFVGQILHVLIGYIDRPSGIQLAGYLLTLSALFIGMNYDRFFAYKKYSR